MPQSARVRLSSPHPRLFLGLSPAECRLDQARVGIIPAPFDQTTSYLPGTRFGPRAILEASCQVELYDEEIDGEPYRAGIATLREIEVEPADLESGLSRLESVVRALDDAGTVPLTLGGEHSLTLGAVRGLRERYPDLNVLQLDAHLDLRESYQGTRLSHASVMRRVRDLGISTAAVGVRSVSREEADYVHGSKLPVFLAREIRRDGLPVDAILGQVSNPVYVTVDLDVFDPAYVPGVGTPEPGGLTWDEGIALLRALCERRQVVGCDVVELCPIPGQPASDFFAAKLVHKMIAYLGLGSASAPAGRSPALAARPSGRRFARPRKEKGRSRPRR